MRVHYVWVVVAAIAQWLLGALWYGVIFRKSWRKLVGIPDGEKPKNWILAMITAFVACLLLSLVMAHFFTWTGVMNFSDGFTLGAFCWLGFMAPPLLAQHIFEGRRVNLFLINAAYWLLAMGLGGAILAMFH